ncbi:PREDICTED: heparanase-like [Vollenhovia emeryi]|uniref:heparanase-like n=1 Tax=Vollenhovia emeryi TaxID=411798 RepID=UPI0005F53BD7|nr:PREDICTED: heparanase-like [Vollenhovia emeryi]XP_011863951.1 PREDICTED: heparanase-like [Vollenhovia emeryi]XP_011863952.1 PREDICTED: heparanase-like [Vollenhovia emeryi]XP_011863953.1 PREDICTED: heparanase-like [Vollenhovia emeryi]XP_011863954.1 PREDICTED: heparanase-like [Vollenhovia emeryi]
MFQKNEESTVVYVNNNNNNDNDNKLQQVAISPSTTSSWSSDDENRKENYTWGRLISSVLVLIITITLVVGRTTYVNKPSRVSSIDSHINRLHQYNQYNEYNVYFDALQPVLHIVSDQFLSFGLDTSLLRRMNKLPIERGKFIKLASHLSPAYLRIGGTSADCLTFVENQTEISSSQIFSPINDQDISNFTISGDDLLAIYNFSKMSNLRMIFDLNVLLRNPDGSWNDSNARKIIAFAKNKNMTLDWQLGNEPNSFKHVFNVTISPSELAKDYAHLRKLLNEAGYKESFLVGPEVNHVGEQSHMGEVYAETFLSSQTDTVNFVTWHQYYLNGREAEVKDFVNPNTFNWLSKQIESMKEYIAKSGRTVPMWLSETSTAFGGGAPGLSDRFVAGFLWLDKLGCSAKAGVKVVTRQSLFGGDYAMVSPSLTPNPDWWVSVFYKRYVSGRVLDLDVPGNNGTLRLYAHCSTRTERSIVTLYGVNIANRKAVVNLSKKLFKKKNMFVKYYILTSDNLQSSKIKANDEELKLKFNGDLPEFHPRIIISTTTTKITLPPYSMVFALIYNIFIPVCRVRINF